jgi:CoA:oxalate CoA-transferase
MSYRQIDKKQEPLRGRNAMKKPLSGLKVLDFSAVFAGPICTRILSDCGAEVVKVEPPRGGDVIRGPRGTSSVFSHFNAGKRSVAINLNEPAGQDVARSLARDADIVVENYRPGIMSRFGLDYDSLKAINEKLIYCSISGFGQSGPFARRAAYAPIAHAASGFDYSHMESQPDPNAAPPAWGIMVADMLTGSYAYGAILTALLGREKHGAGEYIDVTMMESMMMLIPGQMQTAQIENPPPAGGFRPIRVKDGFVMICILSEKNLRCLCEAIDRPDMLEGKKFRSERPKHFAEFVAQIEAWSGKLNADECEKRLNEAGVPCSVYNKPSDLFSHPQILERKSFKEFDTETSKFLIQNAPFKFTNVDISTANHSPALGEHTEEVLVEELGISREKLNELKSSGVL